MEDMNNQDLYSMFHKAYDTSHSDRKGSKKKMEEIKEILDKRHTPYTSDYNSYPSHNDPHFMYHLSKKAEFFHKKNSFNIEELQKRCSSNEFTLGNHQQLLQSFIHRNTPYRGLLIFHGVGVGKTCTAINISNSFRDIYTSKHKKIICLVSGNIQPGWKNTIYDHTKGDNQCTGDTYHDIIQNMSKKTYQRQTGVGNKVNKMIKQYYEFYGYREFSGKIDRMIQTRIGDRNLTPKEKKEKEKEVIDEYFSNRLLIIDEVHNMRDDKDTEQHSKQTLVNIEKIIKYSKNMRLILLSATPLFNEPNEIRWMLNMLLKNDNRPPIKDSHLFDADYNLTDEGTQLLLEKSRGYISYVRGENPITFPIRVYPDSNHDKQCLTSYPTNDLWNNPIHEDKQFKFMKLYSSKFSDLQSITNHAFIQDMRKKSSLGIPDYKKGVQLSNIVYPTMDIQRSISAGEDFNTLPIEYTKMTGDTGISNIMRQSVKNNLRSYSYRSEYLQLVDNVPMFDMSMIQKYSSKIYSILNKIKSSTGIVFIYSEYLASGLVPIALALEHMGYNRYNSPNILDFTDNPNKHKNLGNYVFLSGNVDISPNNQKSINEVVSPQNKDGSKIKIILGSVVASEGLDLKNIREIHILEPWFHLFRLEQIIGRGIRFCSHIDLPQEQRNVTVYHHVGINHIEDEEDDDEGDEEDEEDEDEDEDEEEMTQSQERAAGVGLPKEDDEDDEDDDEEDDEDEGQDEEEGQDEDDDEEEEDDISIDSDDSSYYGDDAIEKKYTRYPLKDGRIFRKYENVFFERKGKIINGYIEKQNNEDDTFDIMSSNETHLVKYNEIYKTKKEIQDKVAKGPVKVAKGPVKVAKEPVKVAKEPVKVDTGPAKIDKNFISLLKDGTLLSFRQVHDLSEKIKIPNKLLIWSPGKKLGKGVFLTQSEFNNYIKQAGYSGERAEQLNIKFREIQTGKSQLKGMTYTENGKDKVMKYMYPVNDTRLLKTIGLLEQSGGNHHTPNESVDIYMYRNAELKARKIGDIEQVLKKNSIDCYLNHQINYISPDSVPTISLTTSQGTKLDNFEIYDKPHSKICSFQDTCDYSCSENKELLDSITKDNLDFDTFDISTSPHLLKNVLTIIISLYGKENFYTLGTLLDEINNRIDTNNIIIFYTLDEMVKNKTPIWNMHGKSGFLHKKEDMYLFQPNYNQDPYLPITYRQRSTETQYKYIELKNIFPEPPKKQIQIIQNDYQSIINSLNRKIRETDIIDGSKEYDISPIFDKPIPDKFKLHHYLDDLTVKDKATLLQSIILMKPKRGKIEYDIFDYFKYNLIQKVQNKYLILQSNIQDIVGFFLANTSKSTGNILHDFTFYMYDDDTWKDIHELPTGEIIKKNIVSTFKKHNKIRLQTSNIWTHSYKDTKQRLKLKYIEKGKSGKGIVLQDKKEQELIVLLEGPILKKYRFFKLSILQQSKLLGTYIDDVSDSSLDEIKRWVTGMEQELLSMILRESTDELTESIHKLHQYCEELKHILLNDTELLQGHHIIEYNTRKTDVLSNIQMERDVQDFIIEMVQKIDRQKKLSSSKTFICLIIETIFRMDEDSTPETSKNHVFIPYDLVLLKYIN